MIYPNYTGMLGYVCKLNTRYAVCLAHIQLYVYVLNPSVFAMYWVFSDCMHVGD